MCHSIRKSLLPRVMNVCRRIAVTNLLPRDTSVCRTISVMMLPRTAVTNLLPRVMNVCRRTTDMSLLPRVTSVCHAISFMACAKGQLLQVCYLGLRMCAVGQLL